MPENLGVRTKQLNRDDVAVGSNSREVTARLIINADDYGYFEPVSAGILEAAAMGRVTATGILANSLTFERQVQPLLDASHIDVGVHLNLSHGRPLTRELAALFARWDGCFPGKFSVAARVITARLPIALVVNEWRAQIQRCKAAGLNLRFVNSHEHLHMLPRLYSAVSRLAREFEIPFVRHVQPAWPPRLDTPAVVRDAVMFVLHRAHRKAALQGQPTFVGLSASGKLTLDFIRETTRRFVPGHTYELMCHPGRFPSEAAGTKLSRYHDWEGELALLKSAAFGDLLENKKICIARFRDLDTAGTLTYTNPERSSVL